MLMWIALFVLGYGLVSKRLERTMVTPPMVFVLLGLLFGGGSLASLGMGLSWPRMCCHSAYVVETFVRGASPRATSLSPHAALSTARRKFAKPGNLLET